jgi:hypothetical protein
VARYRIAAIGTHQTSGIVMGEGMGECSSGEEKYKWRKSVNANEFDATPEDRRRTKFGKQYDVKQVRTEPADLANTILKRACKRAQVAMILNVTAASDCFTQDIEDLPEELRPGVDTETGEIVNKREAKPEPLPQDVFDAQSESWKKVIVSGKKTVDALVSWINAKGALLTDGQKQVINSWIPSPVAVDDDFVKDMEKAEGELV